MKRPAVIIFLGPPGIGKGTQATKVAKALHIPHISTGDILRENIKMQTQLGNQTKALIEAGKLVPDDLICKMIGKRVEENDCTQGYILDGFPRTIQQALWLEEFLDGKSSLKVISYVASDETIVVRLCGRLTCKTCGQSYHKTFSPPKEEGICDACSGELVQRKDDQEQVIRERLAVYEKQTAPLIDFYLERGIIETISCETSIDKIFDETVKKLKK